MKIRSDRRSNCTLAAAVLSCAFAALVLAVPHAAREIKWLHFCLAAMETCLTPVGPTTKQACSWLNWTRAGLPDSSSAIASRRPRWLWFRRLGDGWSRYVIDTDR